MSSNRNVLGFCVSPAILLQVSTSGFLPIRIMAGIALAIVIGVFIWVLRHLRKIEKNIVADNLVPTARGPRNNMILMVCAIAVVTVSLLVFLILKG